MLGGKGGWQTKPQEGLNDNVKLPVRLADTALADGACVVEGAGGECTAVDAGSTSGTEPSTDRVLQIRAGPAVDQSVLDWALDGDRGGGDGGGCHRR